MLEKLKAALLEVLSKHWGESFSLCVDDLTISQSSNDNEDSYGYITVKVELRFYRLEE